MGVYIAAFPGFTTNARYRIAAVARPAGAPTASCLYLTLDAKMMAVEVKPNRAWRPLFHVSSSKRITREPVPHRVWCYGGGPEVPVVDVVKEAPTPITAIVDWPALLPLRR